MLETYFLDKLNRRNEKIRIKVRETQKIKEIKWYGEKKLISADAFEFILVFQLWLANFS